MGFKITGETRMNATKPTPPRRARPATDRQDQILDAAVHLFAEQGFHKTTTREIAEAAGVAEGTLYNYFASKDELLMGIMARLTESVNKQGKEIDDLPIEPRQYFYGWLELRKHFQQDNTTMMQAVFSEILANAALRTRYYEELLKPSIRSFEETLQRRIEAGEIRAVAVPETARVFVALIIGLFMMETLEDPLARSESTRIDQATISLLFDGLNLEQQGGNQSDA